MKKKSDIKYLSFEGGGGKGNAYLGAVRSLEELGILKFYNNKLKCNIKGISGASAGAITAFFLGSGFSYDELLKTMVSFDFNEFFDYPVIGENVIAGKGFSFFNLEQGLKKFENSPITFPALVLVLYEKSYNKIVSLIDTHLSKENPGLAQKLKERLSRYVGCLISDFGLFSGTSIQENFFEFMLQYKICRIQNNITSPFLDINETVPYLPVLKKMVSSTFKPCTFREHFKIFGIELAFTSVNFKTENVYVFSHKTTPDFPISTAARMSMSLPIIYKPVIINQESLQLLSLTKDYEGLWVDGGLFDNAPARVFNDVEHTILFRLGNRLATNQINDLIDFLKTYLKIGIMGSGSGQVNSTTVPDLNVVELNVSNLSLLKFNLDIAELTRLIKDNKEIVDKYFKNWEA